MLNLVFYYFHKLVQKNGILIDINVSKFDLILLLAGLSSNLLHGFLDGGLVTKELHRLGWFHVLVKLVDKGNASWQVQAHDLLFRN